MPHIIDRLNNSTRNGASIPNTASLCQCEQRKEKTLIFLKLYIGRARYLCDTKWTSIFPSPFVLYTLEFPRIKVVHPITYFIGGRSDSHVRVFLVPQSRLSNLVPHNVVSYLQTFLHSFHEIIIVGSFNRQVTSTIDYINRGSIFAWQQISLSHPHEYSRCQ